MGVISSFAKEAMSFLKFACCIHVTHTYLLTFGLTYGPSMLPTINLTRDLLLAEKISIRFGKVGPGDIVILRSPVKPKYCMGKRVIGMEGDTVTYVVDPKNSDRCETIVVPKGHVWIEGDNIYNSNDSRKFGAVPYGLLHAKVFLRIWPPKDFGRLGPRPN